MQRESPIRDCVLVGIERVALAEFNPVARVDVMTRNPAHALFLETRFAARPFRFRHGGDTLHAFPRLPACAVRAWLEEQGLAFVLGPNGLAPDGPETWIHAGHAH